MDEGEDKLSLFNVLLVRASSYGGLLRLLELSLRTGRVPLKLPMLTKLLAVVPRAGGDEVMVTVGMWSIRGDLMGML